MPLRTVVLLNSGPPFGGFRVAMRPVVLGLDQSKAFRALEQAIDSAYEVLNPHPPSAWPDVAQTGAGFAVPRWAGREGFIDFTGSATDDTSGDLVARAFLPFRAWPFGGWAVYEGWHRSRDGSWTRFTDEELAERW